MVASPKLFWKLSFLLCFVFLTPSFSVGTLSVGAAHAAQVKKKPPVKPSAVKAKKKGRAVSTKKGAVQRKKQERNLYREVARKTHRERHPELIRTFSHDYPLDPELR